MAASTDRADPAGLAAETKKSQNRAPGARRVALLLGAQKSWGSALRLSKPSVAHGHGSERRPRHTQVFLGLPRTLLLSFVP